MRMRIPLLCAGLLLAGAALAAPQDARALPADGPVSVSWNDPAGFTEVRASLDRAEALKGDWVRELATYLRQEAADRLPAGERLEVRIEDVRRAGDYVTHRAPTRIASPLSAPEIRLHYVRTDASGAVLAEGERTLKDLNYLAGPATRDRDPLRYEKRLIDRWLRDLPSA